MLWQYASGGLNPAGEWHVLDGYSELSEYRQAAAAQAQARKQKQLKITGDWAAATSRDGETSDQARAEGERVADAAITVNEGYFQMKTQGGMSMVFDHKCLPDTVDPRGPKGK